MFSLLGWLAQQRAVQFLCYFIRASVRGNGQRWTCHGRLLGMRCRGCAGPLRAPGLRSGRSLRSCNRLPRFFGCPKSAESLAALSRPQIPESLRAQPLNKTSAEIGMRFALDYVMRTCLLLLCVLLGIASCKSAADECGGCRLRYCDEPPSACDCGCLDGAMTSGATCKNGCFVRPPDQGTIDCSQAGCAAPPLCSTGCTAVCGCCPCIDGTIAGGLRCTGGCYVPVDMR